MRWTLKQDFVSLLSIAASISLAWFSFDTLPPQVPSHFTLDGTADAYASKAFLVLMMPGAMVLLYFLLTFIFRIDPFWKKIQNRYGVLLVFRDIIMVFMLFLFSMMIVSAHSGRLDKNLIGIGLGLLFILMGNYLPRLPRNFFVGIRTPWTIASDIVWKKTHIVSGWIFVAGGILICVLTLAGIPLQWVLLSVLVPVFLISALIYPFLLYRKVHREDETQTSGL